MSNLVIFASSNATQTGVIVTDQTDWTSLGILRSSLINVTLNLFNDSLVSPTHSYILSNSELALFVTNGEVEVSMQNLGGSIYLDDGWYWIQATANTLQHDSYPSGFGIYAEITGGVFSQVNNLHVPEDIKYNAENIIMPALYLEGLKYLDTTSVNSRDTKFKKTLLSIQKMLLKI